MNHVIGSLDVGKALQVCRDLRQVMIDGKAAEYTDSGRVGEILGTAGEIMPQLRSTVLASEERPKTFTLDESIAPEHQLLAQVVAEMAVVDALSALADGFSWEDVEFLDRRAAAALGSLGILPSTPGAERAKDVFYIVDFNRDEVVQACRMLQAAYNHGARNNATMEVEQVSEALEKALSAFPGLEDKLSSMEDPLDAKVDTAFVEKKDQRIAMAGGIAGIVSADSAASENVDWEKVDEVWSYAKAVLKAEKISLRSPMATAKSLTAAAPAA